ncbi:condensin complex component cnd2 [Cryomyces antarcticus]
MPRVRANGGHAPVVATPHKSPMKIPLNDDRQEKAKRLQSRQAVHEMQINQLKEAVTPLRRRKSLIGGRQSLGGDLRTPVGKDDDGMVDGIYVGGRAVTPMRKVPILANFEEWMKMATDNKINATNSWNFALIDYFHDMSLLKEGDGVNFQKASCTLDGCVKIYTSRVDSVATETGKLLSGLADSGNKKQKGDNDEGEGDDGEEEEGEDGVKKRTKKKVQRSSEATLATSFAQLQLKKMELEFSVDPLFKKASADFDEGGAKGLLLNHLTIDGRGRIVFDSSDDTQDASAEDTRRDSVLDAAGKGQKQEETGTKDMDIDLGSLATRFFPDLSRLDEQDICPSLKTFDLGDPSGSLDLPFLKAPEDWKQDDESPGAEGEGDRSGIFLDEDNAMGFDDDDDDDGNLGGFDLPPETGFGEGGEAWAREAAIEPQVRVRNAGPSHGEEDEGGIDEGEAGAFEPGDKLYAVSLNQGKEDDHSNILNYFDQALSKNWAGPEHWKIKRIKDASKPTAAPAKRKEKESFEIDFAAPMSQSLADALYTPATSKSAISLPKVQWKSKTRNLLPDDKHFNSRQLLRLFLKPKARLGSKRTGTSTDQSRRDEVPDGEMDEAFWARNAQNTAASADNIVNDEAPRQGDYDANFFQDDAFGAPMQDDADDFADAREAFSPIAEGSQAVPIASLEGALNGPGSQDGAFGAQLVAQSRRFRPEYVQYARVAKKVDVRRLKEEMWRGIGFEGGSAPPPAAPSRPHRPPPSPLLKAADGSLKFTHVMQNLQSVYPSQQMADISTSYCFICLLHLANEKGLVIHNEPGWEELSIWKDESAGAGEGGGD